MSLLSDEDVNLINSATKFTMQYTEFRYSTSMDILENILLPQVKAAMLSLGYSQKIIDGTTVNIVSVNEYGDVKYEVVSEYTTDTGFDVAVSREEGTRRHFVKPIHGKVLSWVSGYVRLFSKGHWVRGITKSNIIEKTITRMEPKLQQVLDERTDSYYKELGEGNWQ